MGRARTMKIFPVLVWMLIPGCWALTGPGTVRGHAGGSVAVRCAYGEGYESYKKYWYREGPGHSGDIARSSGTEAEVKRGRVSLRDNHKLGSFTVTVENLHPADAGTYLCGVDRPGWFDLTHTVQVTVAPALGHEKKPGDISTARDPTKHQTPPRAVPASPTPAPQKEPTVDASSTESPFTWTVPEVTESTSTVHSSDPPAWTIDPVLHIRTPCVLVVLLLILLTAIAFIKTSQRRNKALEGAPGQGEKNFHLYQLLPGNAPSLVTNAHLACSEAAVCTNVGETPDSAAPEPDYENATQKDPGSRMNRRNYSWQ